MVIRIAFGKKPFQDDRLDLIPADLSAERRPRRLEPRPGIETVNTGSGRIRETTLFHVTAERYQKVPLNLGKRLMRRQPRFDPMRDRQIDVVASQEEVIAHGDSLDPRKRCFGAGGDLKESEIGGATSDVDDQNVLSARFRESLDPSISPTPSSSHQ